MTDTSLPADLPAIRARRRSISEPPYDWSRFTPHAPADIDALLAEVERLTRNLSQDESVMIQAAQKMKEL